MQTKSFTKRITASFSALALVASVASLPSTAFAASNEFTGTATLSASTVSTAANVTVAFTPATLLTNGGSLVLTLPSGFTGTPANGDITVTQTGATFGADVFDATARTITTPITTAGTGAVSIVIANTTLTNPATAGQYMLQVSTKNSSGVVIDTGYAIASVANTTTLTAVVGEALVMTVNNTALNFNVDPSANSGQDTSQSSTLTIASNAWNGFQVFATLASPGGANKLYDSVSTQSIPSSNDAATDNYLKITSTNPTNAITGASVITSKTFGGAALSSGTSPIFSTAAANASTAALTNSTTVNLAYDLNVDYTTPAGTYAGTITYTATPAF